MPRLIRSAALNNYVELSRSLGLDPYRMITACGLPAACLDDPDTKVPLASVIKLLEQSALKSGKPDFGLRMAENRFVLRMLHQTDWTHIGASSAPRFGSIKISTALSACLAILMSRFRRPMPQWRSRSSNISIRSLHAQLPI